MWIKGEKADCAAVKMWCLVSPARYLLLFGLITSVIAPVPEECRHSSGPECVKSIMSSIGVIIGAVVGACVVGACCIFLCCRNNDSNNEGDTNLTTDQRLERIEAAITLRNNESKT